MADDPKPPENDGTDPEKGFWDKMGALIDERVDAGIARTVEKYRVTSTSRNGGRTSLPEVVAGLMFGKPKSE